MKLDSSFFWGVAVGVVGVWAMHRYAKPLATTKT